MVETGMIRRIDNLGRIVLPMELRRTKGISEGTPVEISVSSEGILLKKYCPEEDLSGMAKDFMRAVEASDTDLGEEKVGEIKLNLQKIMKLLYVEISG